MSQLMFLLMSTLNSTIFMVMKHPMSMGITLLAQTVFICLITNNTSQNAWFSYILFLVFLGGMLVLFIYMTSVASNELFMKNKMSSFVILILMNGSFMLMFMLLDPMLLSNNCEDSMIMYKMNNSTSSLTMSLFNYPNNLLTLFMVIYLFLTLIVVVKITEFNQGPLRTTD